MAVLPRGRARARSRPYVVITRRLPMLSRTQQHERTRRVSRAIRETRTVKRSFAGIVRPYLIAAAVAAATIDAFAAIAVLCFGVPQSLFETTTFRALGVGLVTLAVFVTYCASAMRDV